MNNQESKPDMKPTFLTVGMGPKFSAVICLLCAGLCFWMAALIPDRTEMVSFVLLGIGTLCLGLGLLFLKTGQWPFRLLTWGLFGLLCAQQIYVLSRDKGGRSRWILFFLQTSLWLMFIVRDWTAEKKKGGAVLNGTRNTISQ